MLNKEEDLGVVNLQKKYRKRLLVSRSNKFFYINISDVACFLIENKISYVITFNRDKYIIDMSLNKLVEDIDPLLFFRTNRMSIININAFHYFEYYHQGKLVVKLKVNVPVKIFISKCKATLFKNWLGA